MYIQIVKENQR